MVDIGKVEKLVASLKTRKKRYVFAWFDGSGDSGMIENTCLSNDKKRKEDLLSYNGWIYLTPAEEQSSCDEIRDLAEELLERQHGGWEINEGAFGLVFIDLHKRAYEVHFNERVESSNYSQSGGTI